MTVSAPSQPEPNRREVLLAATAVSAIALLPSVASAQAQPEFKGPKEMSTFTTSDGTEIFYKD